MKREKDNWIRKEEGEDRSMSVRSWGERRLRGEASACFTRALTHTVPLSSDGSTKRQNRRELSIVAKATFESTLPLFKDATNPEPGSLSILLGI